MPAIITSKTRIYLAKTFLNSFTDIVDPRGMYLFVGRSTPWAIEGEAPLPDNTDIMIRDAWKRMIGGKRVSPADFSHVVRRVDWEVNKTFAQYDDNNPNLFYSDFYCVTDDYHVYKCLGNNNGQPSTIKPTGTSVAIITLGDGYKWKYMYSINISDALKFMTNRWIPCKTLTADDGSAQWTVQENTIPGAINAVTVTNPGVGYTSTPSVVIDGDGVGATAVAVLNGAIVERINITNPGSGYNNATVTISGGGASVDAEAVVVYSPMPVGHGKSAVDELGAYYIMCNTELEQDEDGNLPTVNDFRHIGLLADPQDVDNPGVPSTILAFNQTTVLAVSSVVGDFLQDEVVEGLLSGATGNVVQWDSGTGNLFVNNVVGTFLPGEGIITTSGTGAITAVTPAELIPYTGDVVFMEYRSPISRAPDQTEQVRVIFEF